MVRPLSIRKKRGVTALVLLAFITVVLVAVGIRLRRDATKQRPQPAQDLPLSFHPPRYDLGTMIGRMAATQPGWWDVTFTVTVWDRGPVTIRKISPQCGSCMTVDQSLVGKELPPGSSHSMTVRFIPGYYTGHFATRALVETSPASPTELFLEAAGEILLTPSAAPAQVLVKVGSGETPRAQLHITTVRAKAVAPLRMNSEASSFPGFEVVDTKSRSTVRKLHPREPFPRILDDVDLTLQAASPLGLGTYHYEWVIKWQGGEPDTIVPVLIQVVHPVVPRISSLFCGILAPGKPWRGEVPLDRTKGAEAAIKNITTSQPFLKAELTGKAKDLLEVSLVAPAEAGRHEEMVELHFDGTQLPPLRIPVNFIVTE